MTHSTWWTAREKTWWRNRCSSTALPSFACPHILPHDGTTASISITQSCTQVLFHLFKKGVTMTSTRNFHTKWSMGINISPALIFIFLNQMNRQYVYIIMVSDHTNTQSLVHLTEHIHLLEHSNHFSFILLISKNIMLSKHNSSTRATITSKNCEKRQSTFCITQYLGSYCVRQVGRYGCLCIILHAYKNVTTNEQGNDTANKWNHKVQT